MELDEKYNDIYFKQDIIKQIKILSNKIYLSLKKSKVLKNEWSDENKLHSLLNDCINIENNIKNINIINEIIQKGKNLNKNKIKCSLNQFSIKDYLEDFKIFGKIYNSNYFTFIPCSINIQEKRKFIISGDNNNILTKNGDDSYYAGTISNNVFQFPVTKYTLEN